MNWTTAIVACALLGTAAAAAAAPSSDAGAPAAAGIDARRVEAAFDEYFGPARGLAYTGAVVAMVERGEIRFLKGYGFEDAMHRQPVDPEATLFRLASITKTFGAVAIGQLLDEGAIQSLDDPVNRYLKTLELPLNQGNEITLRMLGTHQAGFAERRMPFQRAGETRPTLDGEYWSANLPAYIRPVNSGSNYSNFGIAVLGLAVEDVTGLPFPTYAQQKIFAPAGMRHSVFIEEPKALPRLSEVQSFFADGTTAALSQSWSNHPLNLLAGAGASTGRDMAHYMIALMGGNPSLGIAPLLRPATAQLIMSRLGGTHPLAQGYGVVFMHNVWNGHALAEHGGRTLGGSSYLTLIPESGTGIFVAVTGETEQRLPVLSMFGIGEGAAAGPPGPVPPIPPLLSGIRAVSLETLFGRYSAPPAETPPVEVNFDEYTGDYIGERRSVRSVTEWFSQAFLGAGFRVRTDGTALITPRGRYVPLRRDVFWRVEDPKRVPPSGWSDGLFFRRDAQGRVVDATFLYTDVLYRKASALTAPGAVMRWLPWAFIVLLTGLLGVAWKRGASGRRISVLVALSIIALPFVFFACWPRMTSTALSFVSIRPADLVPFQIAGNLLGILLLVLVWRAVRPRAAAPDGQGWRARLARFHLWLLAVAAVPALWGMWQLGLLGWNVS